MDKKTQLFYINYIEHYLKAIIAIRKNMTCSQNQKKACHLFNEKSCDNETFRCWDKVEGYTKNLIGKIEQNSENEIFLKHGIENYNDKYTSNFKLNLDYDNFSDDLKSAIRFTCFHYNFHQIAKEKLYYRFLHALLIWFKNNVRMEYDEAKKTKDNNDRNENNFEYKKYDGNEDDENIEYRFSEDSFEQDSEYKEYDENEDANRMEDILNEIFPKPNKEQKVYINILMSTCNIKNQQINDLSGLVDYLIIKITSENKNKSYKNKKPEEIDVDSLKGFIMYCIKQDDSGFIKKTIDRFHHFSKYAAVINSLINISKDETTQQIKAKRQNNPNTINQIKIKELIKNFNKIRKIMSVCLSSNDKITTSVDLYNACKKSGYEIKKDKSIKSTCEKELHRITSLFRQDVGFNVTETIKSFSPNKFAKIYDIHAVPNILLNFAILDILNEKNNDGEYIYKKIPKIIDLLFLNIEEKDIDDIKDNFRKHALRDRLIELSEYGFVKKDGDKYALNSMYLNEDQINALKWVVPFFCGCYPFTSIGHFLANRLEISDMFVFESFNIKNILDDCVTYDLLEAINNKQEVSLKLYNNEKPVKFKPNEIYTDKNNKSLLTVKDKNDNKYLLSQIDTVEQDVKTKNLIFSEIYSFYYRIIEESLKKRTPENDVNESSIKEIIEKFGTKDTNNYPDKDTNKIFIQAINNIIRKLQNLDNCLIPLTTLELRWLKTIMLDKRFDLFVDNKETLFDDLVKDIEPFDLSCFKDINGVSYKEYWSKDIFNNTDKKEFQKKLKNKEKITYSLKENKIIK